MAYLLDTNVISELFRTDSNLAVSSWFKSISNQKLYLSVLTLGEIRKGVEKLQDSEKKQRIIQWLEYDLITWFEDRLLPVNHLIADKWGFLTAHSKKPLPVIDALIAATALVHNLNLVTRNTKDFTSFSLELINPWKF